MVTEEQIKEEEKKKFLTVLPTPEKELKKETSNIVEKIIGNLEQTYREEKAKEIQNLYNAIVDAVTSQGNPHISNILTAIKLVEHDIINQKLEQIKREQGET